MAQVIGRDTVAVPDRRAHAIEFPNVVGFTIVKEALRCDVDKVEPLTLEPQGAAKADVVWTSNGWRLATAGDKTKSLERLSRKQFYQERPLDNSVGWLAAYITEILAGSRTRMKNQPTSNLRLQGPRLLLGDVAAIVHNYIDRRVKVSRGACIEDVALGCYRNAIIERLVPAIELNAEGGAARPGRPGRRVP